MLLALEYSDTPRGPLGGGLFANIWRARWTLCRQWAKAVSKLLPAALQGPVLEVRSPLTWMIRTLPCQWEPLHSSLPFWNLPAALTLSASTPFCCSSVSQSGKTWAFCYRVVDFALPGHPKRRRREKSFLLRIVLHRPSDSDSDISMVGWWLIKGVLGIAKPASLWASVCVSSEC